MYVCYGRRSLTQLDQANLDLSQQFNASPGVANNLVEPDKEGDGDRQHDQDVDQASYDQCSFVPAFRVGGHCCLFVLRF